MITQRSLLSNAEHDTQSTLLCLHFRLFLLAARENQQFYVGVVFKLRQLISLAWLLSPTDEEEVAFL
jgi:hypothetical protein